MNHDQSTSEYLYATAVPVLLGSSQTARKTASEIYLRHRDVTPHWFGRGCDFRLTPYVKRHILPAPLWEMSDELLLQILLDFASEESGLLLLFPCDEDAKAFADRNMLALESRYVILPPPVSGDPLASVVLKND